MSKVLSRIGTVFIGLVMLGGGALVLWNVFGQGPYGDTCQFSLGCRSFYCLSHELQGSAQVSSKGRCTKSCDADSECGAKAVCVTLSEASRDDLPPFGKPDKACMVVRDTPADIRQ
ncbi:MAG: hypothetical protein H0T42_20675 [Deltaproteobacteria bacterium]|nr:hypothetical protein [Deltaproteobacteria bacterium]